MFLKLSILCSTICLPIIFSIILLLLLLLILQYLKNAASTWKRTREYDYASMRKRIVLPLQYSEQPNVYNKDEKQRIEERYTEIHE